MCGMCGPWEGHHGILDTSIMWELENDTELKVLGTNPIFVALYMNLRKENTKYWINELCGNWKMLLNLKF